MLITKDKDLKTNFEIQIEGKTLRHSPQLKILGNMMSDDLSWDKHVQLIVLPGVRNRLRTLNLTTKYLDPKFRKNYVNSIYRSKLMYAIETWGGVKKTTLQKLQKMQNQAAKFAMAGQHPRDSENQRQTRLGWLSIQKEVQLQTHIMTWKTIHMGIPEEVAARMPTNKTGRRIQAQNKLGKKPKWLDKNKINRQAYRSRSYQYNTLPGTITQLGSLKKFKKATKEYLMWK